MLPQAEINTAGVIIAVSTATAEVVWSTLNLLPLFPARTDGVSVLLSQCRRRVLRLFTAGFVTVIVSVACTSSCFGFICF